jgi:phosphoenolpyruvate carboxylase
MQSRHMLPGWYGLGTGLEAYIQGANGDKQEHARRLQMLRAMAQKWPFFQVMLDNAQMMLAKADMTIARHYAALVPDAALADEVFSIIEAEFERTRRLICEIAEIGEMLEREPVLQQSIWRRNEYINPLNYLQIELLQRFRAAKSGPERDELEAALLASINSVAAGLKNTG